MAVTVTFLVYVPQAAQLKVYLQTHRLPMYYICTFNFIRNAVLAAAVLKDGNNILLNMVCDQAPSKFRTKSSPSKFFTLSTLL